jgi:type IV pilus assembly protein PilY1
MKGLKGNEMRMTIARWWLATSATGALVLAAANAGAQQIDVNPPLPNVLLLIDNSGSMERMIDGTLPESTPQNACNCDAASGACTWTAQPAPNRWGVMLQSLTGSLQNGYNCAAMPRSPGSVFATEYQIGGVPPYDVNYYIPYHRPIAEDTVTNPLTPSACVYAPGALPGAPLGPTGSGVGPQGVGAGGLSTDFPSNAIVEHTYGTSNTKACTFAQYQDGALDTELDILRFGLMTFDQDPSPATGTTAQITVANPAFDGMWSYFPGWNTGAACTYLGNPANCTTQSTLAVGARNPAAPPWEGRMIPFPATTDLAAQETQNGSIQQVLIASRPYGATPLAGMFTGAQYYLRTDPSGPQATDPFVQGGCRKQFIILLTDGAPNLDMQPACSALGSPNGVCPFPPPETTAQGLFQPTNGQSPVTTFVIGFAVSSFQDQGTTVYCSNLVANGQLASVCSDPTKQGLYGACCELQKIALNGGSTSAFFADTPGDLQKALGTILSEIAKNATTRTTPAFSSVVSNVLADPNAPTTNESLFLASFFATPGAPWSGDVQRQRYLCSYGGAGAGYSVNAPSVQVSAGDDFAANLNSAVGNRTAVMFKPDTNASGFVDATATIRPYVAASVGDGLGKYSAATVAGDPGTVIAAITPAALNLSANSCPYNPVGGGATKKLSQSQCRDMLLDYTFGQQSFTSNPGDFPFVSRYGNAFGDVFHATPAVVGPPSSLLRDDSYIGFRSTYATRKQIVYVATNDGLLHAFWADETKLENNELWALMPPAVMPKVLSSYPSSHEFLLDGSPVVKDVVWDRPLSNQGDSTTWHTMLVAGFGESQAGYYAVDVTNADVTTGMPSGSVPTDPPPKGPVFAWQLTKMPATNAPLFGAHSATPAITSVFADPGDGKGAREIGVAILPGGQDSGPTTAGGGVAPCDRWAPHAANAAPVNRYLARPQVRCWGTPPPGKSPSKADPVIGRSLSIVRLDTGEILRTFMRLADLPAGDTLASASRITDTPLDSPMTGTPVPYPSDVGADATKVFVGDADGTIWRFDLSSPTPSSWVGELYLDLYNQDVDTHTMSSWADGQPIQVPLVTSLDPMGNVVVHAATGSQEAFDATGVFYLYSISEVLDSSTPKLRAQVNWWLDPATATGQPGERVSGPMTVFDGVVYFATYSAPQAGSQSCASGDARLWGRDYVTPQDINDLSKGGILRLQPPQGPINPLPLYVQPDKYDATLAGAVIPGVSIKATPACAGLGTPGADSYVYGAQHESPSGFTSPQNQFSLYTQVGAKGSGGANTKTYELQLPTPVSPTMIDSWAGVLE